MIVSFRRRVQKPPYVADWISFVLVGFLPIDCYAYIDPNAAGWLFQLLFPLLIFIGGLWTGFRQQICVWWNRLVRRRDKRE